MLEVNKWLKPEIKAFTILHFLFRGRHFKLKQIIHSTEARL